MLFRCSAMMRPSPQAGSSSLSVPLRTAQRISVDATCVGVKYAPDSLRSRPVTPQFLQTAERRLSQGRAKRNGSLRYSRRWNWPNLATRAGFRTSAPHRACLGPSRTQRSIPSPSNPSRPAGPCILPRLQALTDSPDAMAAKRRAGSDAKRPPTVWIIASCRLWRKGREAGVRPKSTAGFSLIDGKDSRARTTHRFPCRPELGNHLPATHGGPSSWSTEGDLIRLPGFRRLTRRVPAARAAAGLPQRSAALRAGSGWGRAALDPPIGKTLAPLQAQLIPVLLYWVLGRFLFRSLRPLPCS